MKTNENAKTANSLEYSGFTFFCFPLFSLKISVVCLFWAL